MSALAAKTWGLPPHAVPAPAEPTPLAKAVAQWKPTHEAYRAALAADASDEIAEPLVVELTHRVVSVMRAPIACPADVRLRMAVMLAEIGRPGYVEQELETHLADGGFDVTCCALRIVADLLAHRPELARLPEPGAPRVTFGTSRDTLESVRARLTGALAAVDDALAPSSCSDRT